MNVRCSRLKILVWLHKRYFDFKRDLSMSDFTYLEKKKIHMFKSRSKSKQRRRNLTLKS